MSMPQSLGIWTAMMLAMMVPSLIPMLARYRRSVHGARGMRLHGLTGLAALGYFTFWAAAGVVLYLLAAQMTMPARWALLMVAGAVQLSAWKRNQLAHCRAQGGCGHHAPGGGLAALRHGLRLGVHCGLCCGNLMLALVAVGAMNPLAMLAAAAAISGERLVPARR